MTLVALELPPERVAPPRVFSLASRRLSEPSQISAESEVWSSPRPETWWQIGIPVTAAGGNS